MNEHKMVARTLEHGSFRTSLDHHMHVAGLSDNGRERVNAALQAAYNHVATREGLQYGLSGNHLEKMLGHIKKDYEGRHDLKPKERQVIETSLRKYYAAEKTPEAHASMTHSPPPSSKTTSE